VAAGASTIRPDPQHRRTHRGARRHGTPIRVVLMTCRSWRHRRRCATSHGWSEARGFRSHAAILAVRLRAV